MAFHGRTIALIDNDAFLRRALERILRARDYLPAGFDSAQAFLASQAARQADCLVIDLDLAGISGLELYDRLGDSSDPAPVIFTTGYPTGYATVRARALGAVEVLAKPFGAVSLLIAIERALSIPRRPAPHITAPFLTTSPTRTTP